MRIELHPASQRGHADHGWLRTYHNFSFADYFNPIRENFGALRVLNDDTVAPGTGFGEHSHNNMEIISIPLSGILEHRDSLGHIEKLRKGEVQVMSAGTGIRHAEYNASQTDEVKFFQIWIYPRERGLKARYDQKAFDFSKAENAILTLVTPDSDKETDALWIQQDAYLSVARLTGNQDLEYHLHLHGNIVFIKVIEGKCTVDAFTLTARDAAGISDTDAIKVHTGEETELLFIEIPPE